MPDGTTELPRERTSASERETRELTFDDFLSRTDETARNGETAFSTNERELLHEVLHGIRTIRYGSILLTVHDGRVVEIEKTVRVRQNRSSKKD